MGRNKKPIVEGAKPAAAVQWTIGLTPTAKAMLDGILDQRIKAKIRDRIDGLAHEPEAQGKPLLGELHGYRSLRAVGQRYRIIYKVQNERVIVLVVGVGIRKEGDKADIYELAQKLIRLRLLGDAAP